MIELFIYFFSVRFGFRFLIFSRHELSKVSGKMKSFTAVASSNLVEKLNELFEDLILIIYYTKTLFAGGYIYNNVVI